MASDEKKDLEGILKHLLKDLRFRKKGGTWWREVDGYIQVVNIQGSQFSKSFYLNLGVYIKALGKKLSLLNTTVIFEFALMHLVLPKM